MRFLEKLNEYVVSLEQDEQTAVAAPEAEPTPEAPAKPEKVEVAPEGYTEMVRLLAKALVINVPPDAIDNLFSTKITGENVEAIREGLEDLINTSGNFSDNPERMENPRVKEFINSVNENNFMSKYKQVIDMMKKYSNDIDINTK
jgi:hypothetical protein